MKKPILFAAGVLAVLYTGYVGLDTFVIPRAYVNVAPETLAITTNDNNEETSPAFTLPVFTEANSAVETSAEYTKEEQTEPSLETATEESSEQESTQSETAQTISTELPAPESTTQPPTEPVTQPPTTQAQTQEVVASDTIYADSNIYISITTYREYGSDIHVADVYLTSPGLIKTAFANDSYGRNIKEKTSSIAQRKGAILAINGDYYGAQESGYVIRNGALYRSTGKAGQQDLVIYADGRFEIICEDEISAKTLLENGAMNVLSFGPGLVKNGVNIAPTQSSVSHQVNYNPRTAIGWFEGGHYCFVTVDGRTSTDQGVTVYQLGEFMQKLGVSQAYNLDGGGSSTMVFNGKTVNKTVNGDKGNDERRVSDIVYIGY